MSGAHISEIFASFQGEGVCVGQRHLFVRFSGCNLRCAYCDTPDSLEPEPEYTVWRRGDTEKLGRNPIGCADLTFLVSPLFETEGPIEAVALTGGEPLLHAPFLREWLEPRQFPVPIFLETNGVLPGALEEVIDRIDIVSMDLKLPSNTGERAFWAEHEAFARIAMRKRLYVKVLIDSRTDRDDFERGVDLVAGLDRPVPVVLQPISSQEVPLVVDGGVVESLYAAARARVADVRVIPQVHKYIGWR